MKYVKAIIPALYSKDLYQDIRHNWHGTGLKYVIILITIAMIPALIKIHTSVNSAFDENNGEVREYLENIVDQIPEISITNGSLSINADEPYTIYDPKTGFPFIIIDTTSKITSFDNTEATILVTKRVLLLKNGNSIERFDVSKIAKILQIQQSEKIEINSNIVYEWIKHITDNSGAVAFIYYIFLILQTFVTMGINIFFLAAIANIICQTTNQKIPFTTIIRFASFSATSVILLEALAMLFGDIFAYKKLVYLTMHSFYLYFAITKTS